MKSLYTLYSVRCINVLCTRVVYGFDADIGKSTEGRYIGGVHDQSAPTEGRMIALKILFRKGCGLD
jgi:hypothetical protein